MEAHGEVGRDYITIESPFHCTPKTTQSAPDVLNPSSCTDTIHEATNNAREPPLTKTLSPQSVESIHLDYFVWLINHMLQKETCDHCFIPTFTAMRSSIADLNFHATTKLLTPILPYLATTYNAILTTMMSFQDTLQQKGNSYGGLWADEGVYHIAKQIQLLKPNDFLTNLPMYKAFCTINSNEPSKDAWNNIKECGKAIEVDLQAFLTEMSSTLQSFAFWNTYVSKLYPIARDLTNSQCCGGWMLYLSAVERAILLFFFFGQTNYSRWAPLFLQDCFQLEKNFPLLYKLYMDSEFVMNGCNKESGVAV